MQVIFPGGTNAGWRRVKAAFRADWTCPKCGAQLRYYWAKCPNDGHPRPE